MISKDCLEHKHITNEYRKTMLKIIKSKDILHKIPKTIPELPENVKKTHSIQRLRNKKYSSYGQCHVL